MTLLELLAAATPARVVAADLGLVAPHGLDRRIIAACARGRAVLGQILGRTGRRRRLLREHRGPFLRGVVVVQRRRLARGRARRHGQRRFTALALDYRPEPPQVADDFFLDAAPHVLEEREALLLVLDQRIALAVAAQADAFLEVVE